MFNIASPLECMNVYILEARKSGHVLGEVNPDSDWESRKKHRQCYSEAMVDTDSGC